MSLWEFRPASVLPKRSDIDWIWHERIAARTVTMLGGTGGVGKSVLVSGFEVSVVTGTPFLDADVEQGEVWHLDFDTDENLQGPWYTRAARGLELDATDLSRITYGTPKGEGLPYLTKDRLIELKEKAKANTPVAIIIDAWASAFPYIKGNDASQVAEVMSVLRDIARCGPAVIMLDHTPKPVAGAPSAVERGLIGSTIKQAGARAVHLLQGVPKARVGNQDVQALHTLKNNLARLADPLGIKRIWQVGGGIRFEVTDLPDLETRAPKLERAMRVIRETVQPGAITARQALIAEAVKQADVSERTAVEAINRLVAMRELKKEPLKDTGDGRHMAYKVAGDSKKVAALCTDSDSADEQGQNKVQTPLHDGLHFAHSLDALRHRLEAGTWDGPDAERLRQAYRHADNGDAEARAALEQYVSHPDVQRVLGGQP